MDKQDSCKEGSCVPLAMYKMRILHVITSLRAGGAEKLMVDLLPRLKAMGHEVDLCVFDGVRTPFYEEIERRGVKVIALGHSVYSPLFIFKLAMLMKGYDVVHSHNTSCQYYVAMAGLVNKCRIFTTEHNTTNRRRSTRWRMLDRWMYGRYEKIVCITELTMSNLLVHIGDDFAKRCVVVYNGIDLSKFRQDKLLRHDPSGDKIVIMVSAFREQKDQKTLIRAMELLPDDYMLLLVGGGEKYLIDDCKDLARFLGVKKRVRFLGVRTDVVSLLHEADVVVLSSHYEGLSLSSLEGMASGRPFVASDVPGLRDVVGGYGVLFPHEDYHALAHEIKQLCDDQEYRDAVCRRCYERAMMFDISLMAEAYMGLYEHCMEKE